MRSQSAVYFLLQFPKSRRHVRKQSRKCTRKGVVWVCPCRRAPMFPSVMRRASTNRCSLAAGRDSRGAWIEMERKSQARGLHPANHLQPAHHSPVRTLHAADAVSRCDAIMMRNMPTSTFGCGVGLAMQLNLRHVKVIVEYN